MKDTSPSLRKIVSNRIKKWRANEGLTQAEFADLCGISADYLQRIESGLKFPKGTTALKICNACDKTLEEFYAGNTEEDIKILSHRRRKDLGLTALELEIDNYMEAAESDDPKLWRYASERFEYLFGRVLGIDEEMLDEIKKGNLRSALAARFMRQSDANESD